jgi:hypothetical protein
MSFIPNTLFGITYMAALAIAGVATCLGKEKKERRILWVLIANFIITRAIVSGMNENSALWLANDFGAVVGFLLYARTEAARACALLFFIIAQFDIIMVAGWVEFTPVAAVSDLLGYIVLIIMAGAANDLDGRISFISHRPRFRYLDRFFTLEKRRTISPSSAMPFRNISESKTMANANGLGDER